MQIDGFDWDAGNWPKCGKHGLSQDQIESLFQVEFSIFDDPYEGDAEHRFRAVGRDASDRYIFIVFCLRKRENRLLIRPISARPMHLKEVQHYERQKT